MVAHAYARIGTGLGTGVGAAFDFVSGATPRAPQWIQYSGFEWLFRLATEPRRLYRRVSWVIPRFVYFFLEALVEKLKS